MLIVLNDAVVHKVDGSRLGGMRVGVDLRHTTVGGPACVRNAKRTLNARWQDGLQIGHFADGFVRLMDSPSSTATPVESYPRYSRRRNPSTRMGRACWCPM